MWNNSQIILIGKIKLPLHDFISLTSIFEDLQVVVFLLHCIVLVSWGGVLSNVAVVVSTIAVKRSNRSAALLVEVWRKTNKRTPLTSTSGRGRFGRGSVHLILYFPPSPPNHKQMGSFLKTVAIFPASGRTAPRSRFRVRYPEPWFPSAVLVLVLLAKKHWSPPGTSPNPPTTASLNGVQCLGPIISNTLEEGPKFVT